MEPVVTPAEMGAIDAAAPEPVEVLIERAGWAVARAALGLLGRTYGARVLVLAGKGNNGNDGRVAARFLAARGVRCRVEGADFQPSPADLARCDLVIDAAYGTGFRGSWDAPDVGPTPVLAVDIPSGVNGLTGEAAGRVLPAAATVTFAAWKPGLLFHPGRAVAGSVTVADIGLDAVTGCRAWHLCGTDLHPAHPAPSPAQIRSLSRAERGPGSSESVVGLGADGWPQPGAEAHKWQRAVWVIGGHGTMLGAPSLAAAAAARAGAGYVALSVPGATLSGPPVPVESVIRPLPARWGADVVTEQARFAALVVGPGLPIDLATQGDVLNVAANTSTRGLVLDGGALDAVAADPTILRGRAVPAVLTPHDGELRRLLRGRAPGTDRIETVRRLAADLGAVVLAKGPTTVAAHPDGRVLVSTAGDQRLASAGTGDVLAGLVGAGLAGGLEPLAAAGLAAELHGRAARLGLHRGFVAGDLPFLVGQWLEAAGAPPRPAER